MASKIPNEILNKIFSYVPKNPVNEIMKIAIKKYYICDYKYGNKFMFSKIRGNENRSLDDFSFEKKFYYTILHVKRKKILYEIQHSKWFQHNAKWVKLYSDDIL